MLTQKRIEVASISHNMGAHKVVRNLMSKSRIFVIHNLFSAIILRNLKF